MNRRSLYITILIIGLVLVTGLVSGLWMRRSYIQMEKLEAKNIRLITEKGALAKEISAIATELNGRDKEIKNLRTRIQGLTIEAEQFAKSQQQLLEQRVDQFTAERTQLAARLKEIETEAKDLSEAKEKAERTIESQQKSISSMKREIATGQIKIAELAEMGEALRDTSIKKEQTISELSKKQQLLLEELEKIRGDKINLNNIIESHQRRGEKYQERLSELSQISHDLQQRMKTFLVEVNKAKVYTQKLTIEKTQLIDRIKETEAGAKELTGAMEKAKRTIQIQQQIISSLKYEIATGQIKITQFANRTTIRLKDKVLFDSGQASIKPSGVALLKKIGKTLQRIRDRRFQIEGHTDSRLLGWKLREKYPTNWELSAARAAIIVRYLIDDVGIEANRLSAVGYGLYQPVASNNSPDGQQENRRVEFALLPLLSAPLENME